MTDQKKKYLIIGPAWVGDMVMAQSLFIDIRQRQPDAIIDVLAPAWTAALIDRMPQVNKLISVDFKHGHLNLAARFRLARQLTKQGYSNAITLPNSLKSALVAALAGIPVRSGFVGEQRWGLLNDIRRLDKVALPMTVQRFIALGLVKGAKPRAIDSIPVPTLTINKAAAQGVLDKYKLNASKRILVLCPGAEFGSSKQWPVEHYAQLAQHYLAQDWQVWLLGSSHDQVVCDAINQHSLNACISLAGLTSLPEAIDLLAQADLVVSNDSGLMHIAAALQKPLVAVYGSTDPGHTPPLNREHDIARLKIACSPCFKRECPLGHHDCMRKLDAASVIDKTRRLLQ